MSYLAIAAAALGFFAASLPTEERQVAEAEQKRSRDDEFKVIQSEYGKARDVVSAAIRTGKIKASKDGRFPELAEVQNRFSKRTRAFIDADPKGDVALEAILFSMRELVADQDDPGLYEPILAHHLASSKLGPILDRPYASDEFLRTVAEKSPHVEIRGQAAFVQAKRFARANRAAEAEAICARIIDDGGLAALHRGAEDLLFEIHNLMVGKIIPEIEGVDLDDKPMKLSGYRGQAVMVVFWATWCAPCMKMVPHERDLAKRFAGRPFAIVGINGDLGREERAKQAVATEQIPWRSFRNYAVKEKREIAHLWNVQSWPTVFLVDHEGVILHIFRGMPSDADLDGAVEALVAAVEVAKKKSPGK